MSQTIIGRDLARGWIDVHLLPGAAAGRIENSRAAVAAWVAGGASGEVQIARLAPLGGTWCGEVHDSIVAGGATAEVRDVVCWGDGWGYVRDPKAVPVLGPAFAEEERVYTVRSGGTLAAVARRTGAALAALGRLNPGHPDRLAAGTRILLS